MRHEKPIAQVISKTFEIRGWRLEQFFLIVGQNNFGNKKPVFQLKYMPINFVSSVVLILIWNITVSMREIHISIPCPLYYRWYVSNLVLSFFQLQYMSNRVEDLQPDLQPETKISAYSYFNQVWKNIVAKLN